MAFDYGSIDLGITNPFRIEGGIRVASGLPLFVLGVVLLLEVQAQTAGNGWEIGATTGLCGVLLIGWGLQRIGAGSFQVFRFFVGRSVPANLATNVEKSQRAKEDIETVYTAQQLEQMLQGRQNISFEEPREWFSRLVHSLFPELLYLPYAYRNLAQRLARAVAQTVIAILSFALAWFSGATGITNVTQTPIMDWMAVLLLIYLLVIWAQASPPLSRLLNESRLKMPGPLTLTLWISGAVALPVMLGLFHNSVLALPALPFSSTQHLFIAVALASFASAIFLVLLAGRSKLTNPVVEVAEYRENWQESIHPQEVFINLENIVMANRRYKEVPNRVYRGFEAKLFEQGSDDKGDFDGELLQETQPVFHNMVYSGLFHSGRIAATCAAAALALGLGLILFNLPDVVGAMIESTGQANPGPLISTVVTLSMLAIFTRILSNFSHAFWAEMQFESLLVYFQCRGTYTASKLSTGTSIYDSTRSENVVVRSSMTPWVIATRAITSTFAASGALNLELARYVLEMHKANDDLDAIITDLRKFMQQREAIASINNEKDLDAASRIFQVNQQTRAQLGHDDGAKHPPVDRDRIQEASGEEPLS